MYFLRECNTDKRVQTASPHDFRPDGPAFGSPLGVLSYPIDNVYHAPSNELKRVRSVMMREPQHLTGHFSQFNYQPTDPYAASPEGRWHHDAPLTPPRHSCSRCAMNPAAAPGVFEEDKSEEEHRIETQQRRLKEGTSELLEQYAELLKSAQIDSNEVAQQVGEVRSAVSAASMVQSGDKLLHLEDELRLSALLSDQAQIAEEVKTVTEAHNKAADDGERRLRAVAAEMQAALRVLEDAYYSSSVLASEGDSNRT